MLTSTLGKKVALGALLAAIVAAGAFFFMAGPAIAQTGVEKSKTAFNITQNRAGQDVTAKAGDVIRYTLTFRNQTDSAQTVTIEDDITDVLYLAEVTNLGGGRMSGKTIRFENVSVPARATVDRTFEIRVKSVPAGTQDTMMSNFYGNGVDIKVETQAPAKGQVQPSTPHKQAPETGTSENVAMGLAGLVTAGIFIINRHRKLNAIQQS